MPDAIQADAGASSSAVSTEPTVDQFNQDAAAAFDAEVAKKPVEKTIGKPEDLGDPNEPANGVGAPPIEKTDEEKIAEAEAAKQAKADAKASKEQNKAAEPPKDIFPEIEKLHPGARAKASTKEFQAWLNTLPANVQAMVDSGDPKASAAVLDMYDMVGTGKTVQAAAEPKADAASVEFKPFTFDQVKDVKFKDESGNEQSLADFRGQYQEIADAALAMINHVLPQVLKDSKAGPSGDYAAKTDLQAFQNQIAGELFESRVERGAPGAGEKIQTPEFKTFIDKATPLQKRMFSEGSPADVISVIKEFDRVQGISAAQAAQQKQRDRKAGLNGTHGNSLRQANSTEKPAAGASDRTQRDPAQDEEDARNAFREAANELDKAKRR